MTVSVQYKISKVTLFEDDDFCEYEAIVSVDPSTEADRRIRIDVDDVTFSVSVSDLKEILERENIIFSPKAMNPPVDRCLKSHEV